MPRRGASQRGRCFSSSFSSGSEPDHPDGRLPPFLPATRPRASLPCFQGHRRLRFWGFCFSAALPILKPGAHRGLPSPGDSTAWRLRTTAPAERGLISQTPQPPSSQPWQTLAGKPGFGSEGLCLLPLTLPRPPGRKPEGKAG